MLDVERKRSHTSKIGKMLKFANIKGEGCNPQICNSTPASLRSKKLTRDLGHESNDKTVL